MFRHCSVVTAQDKAAGARTVITAQVVQALSSTVVWLKSLEDSDHKGKGMTGPALVKSGAHSHRHAQCPELLVPSFKGYRLRSRLIKQEYRAGEDSANESNSPCLLVMLANNDVGLGATWASRLCGASELQCSGTDPCFLAPPPPTAVMHVLKAASSFCPQRSISPTRDALTFKADAASCRPAPC